MGKQQIKAILGKKLKGLGGEGIFLAKKQIGKNIGIRRVSDRMIIIKILLFNILLF